MDSLAIDGVVITRKNRILNPKGDILHCIRLSDKAYAGFGEVYISMVHAGSIKGWKRHHQATLNIVVPYGSIRFVIYDDRPNSLTQGKFLDVIAGNENHILITVPPALWMAFSGVGSGVNLLANISNMEHDPTESDNLDLNKIGFDWGEGVIKS